MPRTGVSSPRLAKLAAKVLDGYEPTRREIRSMAASILTQARNKRRRVPTKLKAAH